MIDAWLDASWKERIVVILFLVGFVAFVWAIYVGTGGFHFTAKPHAANEYCRSESYFVGMQQVGKVMVPQYSSREVCITPIPR